MTEMEIFENLVHDLSDRERMRLLKKLESINLAEPVLMDEKVSEEEESPPVRFELTFFERLIIFIRSFFSGLSRMEAEEQYFLLKLIRKLDKNFPAYFSLEKGELYSSFSEEILNLSRCFSFLREPVQIVQKDKSGFIAFIVELEVPEIQKRLMSETNPRKLEEMLNTRDISNIRRTIDKHREVIFDEIKKNEKEKLYELIKGFYSLQMLMSFPFEKLTQDFLSAEGIPRTCSLGEVKSVLESLWEKVQAFTIQPSNIILEALYLYNHQDMAVDEQELLETELRSFLGKYRKAVNALREFRKKIPMDKIIKILNKNLDYTSRGIHMGGEEWFSLFRRFWEERIQRNFLDYQRERKKEDLFLQINLFLGPNEFYFLSHYRKGRWDEGGIFSFDLSASFVVSFIQTIFLSRINPLLKLIQSEGEFYKEQNQVEFTESYGSLFRLAGKIREIDQGFSDQGAYGRRALEIISTSPPGAKTAAEIQEMINNIEKELLEHLFEFTIKLDLLVNVLGGILFGEVGGKYDSLSNLGYIGGASNDRVLASLKNIHLELKKFLELLHQIQDLEKKQVL